MIESNIQNSTEYVTCNIQSREKIDNLILKAANHGSVFGDTPRLSFSKDLHGRLHLEHNEMVEPHRLQVQIVRHTKLFLCQCSMGHLRRGSSPNRARLLGNQLGATGFHIEE